MWVDCLESSPGQIKGSLHHITGNKGEQNAIGGRWIRATSVFAVGWKTHTYIHGFISRHVRKYWVVSVSPVILLCQLKPEHRIRWHCKARSGNHRQHRVSNIYLLCYRVDLICTLLVRCRPASSECTGPLWITIRLLWRRQTSAARQMLSLQRYLRYVITLCTAGQVFDVVQLSRTSDDRAVFSSPHCV